MQRPVYHKKRSASRFWQKPASQSSQCTKRILRADVKKSTICGTWDLSPTCVSVGGGLPLVWFYDISALSRSLDSAVIYIYISAVRYTTVNGIVDNTYYTGRDSKRAQISSLWLYIHYFAVHNQLIRSLFEARPVRGHFISSRSVNGRLFNQYFVFFYLKNARTF